MCTRPLCHRHLHRSLGCRPCQRRRSPGCREDQSPAALHIFVRSERDVGAQSCQSRSSQSVSVRSCTPCGSPASTQCSDRRLLQLFGSFVHWYRLLSRQHHLPTTSHLVPDVDCQQMRYCVSERISYIAIDVLEPNASKIPYSFTGELFTKRLPILRHIVYHKY